MTRQCEACSGTLTRVKRDYNFTESGLDNVVLKEIEVLECPNCGAAVPRIPRMNDLMSTIALALISKPWELTGQEFRYLRKFLGLNQEGLSKTMDIQRETISRWETGDQPIGPQSDRLIRLIAVGLNEGLQNRMRDVIQQFESMKKPVKKVGVTVNPKTGKYEYSGEDAS